MATRIVNIRGTNYKVGLIPSTREQLLAAPSFHSRLRAGMYAATPPASCLNSSNDPFYDTGGNAPNDSDDQTYTGDPVGDCGVNSWAQVLSVLSSRDGGPLARVWAKKIVAFYFQYTGGQDTGVNIDDFLTYCQTNAITDSTGKGWVAGPHSGIAINNQNAVMQCLWTPDYGAISTGIDSSVFESAANAAQQGYACVVSGLTRKYTSYDHAVPALGYGTAAEIADCRKVKLDTNAINPSSFALDFASWGLPFIVDFESCPLFVGESWATGLPAGAVTPPVPAPTPAPEPSPKPHHHNYDEYPIIDRLATRWDGDTNIYPADADKIQAVVFGA